MNTRVLLASLLLLPSLVLATVRHDPPGRRGGARVILYEHADFRGGSIVLYPGQTAENLARWEFDNGMRANDRISSIRIEGGAEALVFAHSNYRGEALRVTQDIRDLSRGVGLGVRLNDQVSSVRVEFAAPGRRADRRPVPARPGGIDADLIVRRAYDDILERAPDESGLRYYRSMIIDRGWSEKQLRDHLRASDEFRGTVVERIITRVYRDLLDRAPDANGLAGYRRIMIDRGWTEAELRADIMKSPEYRQRLHAATPRSREPLPGRGGAYIAR